MNPIDTPAVLSIGTALPQYKFSQSQAADWFAHSLRDSPAKARWIRAICAGSGIETRSFCIPDGLSSPDESRFAPNRSPDEAATTSERMDMFRGMAPPLAVEAGRDALAQLSARSNRSKSRETASISHLILVTCTGFFAPGLDIAISDQLNLSPNVERIQIGFMGCSALFNAWRTAAAIVTGAPEARVLIVCVEVCSIHLQPSLKRQHLISAALFSDGAGSCVVGAPTTDVPGLVRLMSFYSRVKPDTESEMTWKIGDHGFALYLSPQIPDHLAQVAPPGLNQLFPDGQRPELWAIHPGGKAIVDQLAETFNLAPEDTAASTRTLRQVGNLSSATMVFVLRELLEQLEQSPRGIGGLDGVAMGFGPGLVIEMARLWFDPVREIPPAEEALVSTTQ
ncbi:MAG: type III polyketide synthase [Anaerolineales bacterium]